MRQVSVKRLTCDDFKEYGTFANMVNPAASRLGSEPVEFYKDMAVLNLGNSSTASFSTCRILKRDNIVEELEFHNHTGEGMLPLDGDILLTFAPPTAVGEIPADSVEVFYVPQGTAVVIKPGVWHCAAFSSGKDCVNVLIVLPERVYVNDCHIVSLKEKILIK